jgi:stearoyl-CoA desaturase (delta-9 desaturase)
MLIVIYTLVTIHLGCILASLYMHRYAIHRQYEMGPRTEAIMRIAYWFLFGPVSQEFIVQHRKHHELSDGFNDPHSPRFGYWKLLRNCLIPSFFRPYAIQLSDADKQRYGGTLTDSFTVRYPRLGVILFLALTVALFGWIGIVAWTIHLFAVSFLTIATITVFGHSFGYRNFTLNDRTTNVSRFGILCVGEELHNNHHYNSKSCNFAVNRNEFDLGFFYLSILDKLKIITLKKRA